LGRAQRIEIARRDLRESAISEIGISIIGALDELILIAKAWIHVGRLRGV